MDEPEIVHMRGDLNLLLEKYRNAEDLYLYLIEHDSYLTNYCYLNLAWLYNNRNDTASALKYLKLGYSRYSNDNNLLTELIKVLYSSGSRTSFIENPPVEMAILPASL